MVAPTGAAARAASAETWWRRTNQISEATSIISQALIAISAAGTWMKRILTVGALLVVVGGEEEAPGEAAEQAGGGQRPRAPAAPARRRA